MRALLFTFFALAGTGCSTGAWNGGVPQSPLLGIDNGIWRFPTPQPPSSAELSPEISPIPSALPSSSSSPEPRLPKPKTSPRVPKPYAKRSATAHTF